jgi:hypothetical protein
MHAAGQIAAQHGAREIAPRDVTDRRAADELGRSSKRTMLTPYDTNAGGSSS